MPQEDAPLTQLLQLAGQGDREAMDRVFAVLYPELRQIAHQRLRRQGGIADLATTALVHESFLRLIASDQLKLADRQHFFAYAAKTIAASSSTSLARTWPSDAVAGWSRLKLDTELADELGERNRQDVD